MVLRFGAHVLDDELFQLRREGEPVPLEPKVFDVLRYLLVHRERVVAKDELLESLWPGEAVSESVLPRCIAVARRALGDDRTRQGIIATIHGRGYRFVADVEPEAAALAPEPRTAAVAPPTDPADPFVGREDALERLSVSLAEADAGRGRVSLVCGDPGIGKTRMLGELATRAHERGALWLQGACYEGEGAPAYWPFAQVLRALVPELEASALAELSADAGDLAAWVPDLSARSDVPQLEGQGPQGRFRLFDAVARALGRAAEARTIVIAIDDLHWADHDSVLLFEFLALGLRTERIHLIGTYRDIEVRRGHPLGAALSGLARETGCDSLKLRGLDGEQIAALGAAMAGQPLAAEIVSAVSELTDGNPFFVREIVRLLEDEGRLGASAAPISIGLPQSVRDAVGRRLDALTPECNEILRAASVMGRSFETPLLEAVCTPRGDELLEILAEPLAAGIVQEDREGPGRYRFDHAITRQMLYDELSVPKRVSLHRDIGEALEGFHRSGSDAPLAEIAHHYFEAVPGGDVERAMVWCERAARHAHALFAYEESARHYERALEAHQFSDSGDDARRCDLLLRAGEELHMGGQRDAGRGRHVQAAELARSLGRTDLFARAAIGHRGFGEMGMPPDDLTRSMLEEAREAIGPEYPAIRAQLFAQLAGLPPYSDSMAVRDELSREALRAAEDAGDPGSLVSALSARYWATLGPDRLEERLETGAHALRLAEQIDDLRLAMLGHEMQIGAHLVLGDRAAAHRSMDAYSDGAEALRMPVFRYLARVMRSSLACNDGDFAEAGRLAEEALAVGHPAVPYAEPAVAGLHFWISNVRGGELPNVPFLEHLPNYLGGLEALIRVAGIRMLLDAENPEEAFRVWGEASAELSNLERDENWLMTLSMMSSLAYDLGDLSCGAELHKLFSPYRGLMVAHDLLRGVGSSVSSVLGILEHLLGKMDAAVASLEAGIAQENGFGGVPAELSNTARLGYVLEARGAAGDQARAAELARTVAGRAAELGLELPYPPGLKRPNS
jgi:DNA-binding winged helix-turn-helix (wHTH) protein